MKNLINKAFVFILAIAFTFAGAPTIFASGSGGNGTATGGGQDPCDVYHYRSVGNGTCIGTNGTCTWTICSGDLVVVVTAPAP
jgi:hypothetical protein